MADKTETQPKPKRRSISRIKLVREMRKEMKVTGVTDDQSILTLIDAIKDSFFEDNFED